VKATDFLDYWLGFCGPFQATRAAGITQLILPRLLFRDILFGTL